MSRNLQALADFRVGLLVNEIIVRKTDFEKSMIESDGCSTYTILLPKCQTAILEAFYHDQEKQENALAHVLENFTTILSRVLEKKTNGNN